MYFSNSDGHFWMMEQCQGCVHYKEEGPPCAVEMVQMEFNYDQCAEGQEKLRKAMTMLIDKDGCNMRLEQTED